MQAARLMSVIVKWHEPGCYLVAPKVVNTQMFVWELLHATTLCQDFDPLQGLKASPEVPGKETSIPGLCYRIKSGFCVYKYVNTSMIIFGQYGILQLVMEKRRYHPAPIMVHRRHLAHPSHLPPLLHPAQPSVSPSSSYFPTWPPSVP